MDAEAIAVIFPAAVDGDGVLSLYAVFGVPATATAAQIKVAYYKLAKRFHPDRCRDDPDATRKFQAVGRVYEVLSNEDERKYYDENGEIHEKDGLLGNTKSEAEWTAYWRAIFKKVETSDIDKFRTKFVESEEEANDILEAYVANGGDIFAVIDSVMLASDADEERMRGVIDAAIVAGTHKVLAGYKPYAKCAKQRARRAKALQKEAAEAAEAESGCMDSLVALIQAKNQARGGSNPFEDIIAKYSKQDGPKKARARKDGGKAARGGRAAAGTTKAKRGLKKRS